MKKKSLYKIYFSTKIRKRGRHRENETNPLQFDNDSAYVEIETEPQTFEKRFIETGLSDGINIEVISGLTKDDNIKRLN